MTKKESARFIVRQSANGSHYNVYDTVKKKDVVKEESMQVCSNICYVVNTGNLDGDYPSECYEIGMNLRTQA